LLQPETQTKMPALHLQPRRPMPSQWVRQIKVTKEHPSPTMDHALIFLHRAKASLLLTSGITISGLLAERLWPLLTLLVSLPCSCRRTPLSLLRNSHLGCLPTQHQMLWMGQERGPRTCSSTVAQLMSVPLRSLIRPLHHLRLRLPRQPPHQVSGRARLPVQSLVRFPVQPLVMNQVQLLVLDRVPDQL
jgi:hypothetical protein